MQLLLNFARVHVHCLIPTHRPACVHLGDHTYQAYVRTHAPDRALLC